MNSREGGQGNGPIIGRVNHKGEPSYTHDEVKVMIQNEIDLKIKSLTSLERCAAAAEEVYAKNKEALIAAQQDLDRTSAIYVNSIRQSRVGVISEINAMLTPLKDLRQFFIGPDHTAEILRLREFVELCERLQKLKADGTLDGVCDIILKLS